MQDVAHCVRLRVARPDSEVHQLRGPPRCDLPSTHGRDVAWARPSRGTDEFASHDVGEIARKPATQMRRAQNDDVIETFATQGSDQSLGVRILPGTGRAEMTSVMPMPAARRRNTSLSMASRSLMSHRGAVSSGKASIRHVLTVPRHVAGESSVH